MSDSTIKKRNIALPCHKYMIRHIKSETDKLKYARAFFQKMHDQKVDIDETINSYIGTALFQEGTHYDFLSYRGRLLDGMQFYRSIMADHSIETYQNCQDYIGIYGKEVLPVCKVCPHSSQNTNKNRDIELSIIKRINASYDSLQIFISKSNGTFFKSRADIAQNTPSSAPLVIPFLRICFNIIKSYSAGYYEQSIIELSDHQRLSMLQNRMYAELKSKYKIDAKIPNCSRIFPLLYSSLVDEINRAADISDKDIVSHIMDSKKTIHRSDTDRLAKSSADIFLEYGIEHWTEQFTLNETVIHKEVPLLEDELQYGFTFPNILSRMSTNIKNPQLFSEPPHILSRLNLSNQMNHNEVHPQCPDQRFKLSRIESRESIEPEIIPASVDAFDTKELKDTPQERKPSPAPQNLADGIPLFHINENNLINHLTKIGEENIDMIKKSITKDRDMPCECAIDDSGYAIILWIRAERQFFYSYFTNLHFEIIELFTSNTIKKICYQPFYLYSLCRLHGIKIKHVDSIFNTHLLLKSGYILNYSKMVKLYGKIKPDYHSKCSISERNNLMDGIPLYRMINRIQTKLVLSSDSYLAQANKAKYIEEVLGISFMRSINFYDDSTLLYIENDQIKFNHNFKKTVKRDGFLLTYTINNKDIDTKAKQKIFLDLLYNLSEKGKIRKLNLQLMTMYDDIMVLFVSKECYEYFTTYIFAYMRLLRRTGMKNFM